MSHSRFGYSAVNCFEQCPQRYKYTWLDNLKTIPTDDPANALILGTAIHKAIETDINTAISEYFQSYRVISDLHINEEIKMRYLIPKVKEKLPDGIHEVEIECGSFKGTLDLLVPVGENLFDLYDFKYSNNIENYRQSKQLHLYKYYYEKTHPGCKIRKMYFIFIPKVQIRQKKTEDLFQFRQRLLAELKTKEITPVEIEYSPEKVIDHLESCQNILTTLEFPKNPTRLCDWCEFKNYCTNKEDYMLLPKNERKQKELNLTPDFWIYAQSYVGKTTFVDTFDDVLFLNTDGNIDNITSPVIRIRDEWEGRIKKNAWEVFLEVVKELEKKENDFKIIAIDLIEDLYEHCRLHVFNREGWQHESDGGYGKGYDMVKLEFLSTMKRLKNLGYQIVYISKELAGQVILRGNTTITTYKPNINDKVANVLAGTVDLTCRAYADDRGRWIGFKADEYTFGGGRFDFKSDKCELNRDAFIKAINDSQRFFAPKVVENTVKEENAPEEPTEAMPAPVQEAPAQEEVTSDAPVRRTRRTRN